MTDTDAAPYVPHTPAPGSIDGLRTTHQLARGDRLRNQERDPFASSPNSLLDRGQTGGPVNGAVDADPDRLPRETYAALEELQGRLFALDRFAGPAIAGPLVQAAQTAAENTHRVLADLQVAARVTTSLRADVDAACRTIADMHLAAVGEVRGPIRGVVADVVDVRTRRDAAEEALTNALVDEGAHPGLLAEIDHLQTTMRRWADRGYVHPTTVNKAIARAEAARDQAEA